MHFPIELAVSIVFVVLANAFPYKAKDSYIVGNFKALQKQYAKWELFAIVPLFILAPLLVYGFGNLFLWLNSFPKLSPETVFLISPNMYMWFLPSTFLMFAVIVFPMTYFYKLLLKDSYDEYLHYTNLRHGFDGMRIYRPMAWAFAVVAVASVFLMTDYSIEITDRKIILNDFSTVGKKSYDFKQIKTISYVENTISKDRKTISPRPHYLLKFNDGNYWNTMSGLIDENNQAKIIEYLAEKSDRVVDTASYIAD